MSDVVSPLPQFTPQGSFTPPQEEDRQKAMRFLTTPKPSALMQGGQHLSPLPQPGMLQASHGAEAARVAGPVDTTMAKSHKETVIGQIETPDGRVIDITNENQKKVYALLKRAYPQMFASKGIDLPGASEEQKKMVAEHPEKYQGLQYKTPFEEEQEGQATNWGDVAKSAGSVILQNNPLSASQNMLGQGVLPAQSPSGKGVGENLSKASLLNIPKNIKDEFMSTFGGEGTPSQKAGTGIGSAFLLSQGLRSPASIEKTTAKNTETLRKYAENRAETLSKPTPPSDLFKAAAKWGRRVTGPGIADYYASKFGTPMAGKLAAGGVLAAEAFGAIFESAPARALRAKFWGRIAQDLTNPPPPPAPPYSASDRGVAPSTTQREPTAWERAAEERVRRTQEKGSQPFTPREKAPPPEETPPTGTAPTGGKPPQGPPQGSPPTGVAPTSEAGGVKATLTTKAPAATETPVKTEAAVPQKSAAVAEREADFKVLTAKKILEDLPRIEQETADYYNAMIDKKAAEMKAKPVEDVGHYGPGTYVNDLDTARQIKGPLTATRELLNRGIPIPDMLLEYLRPDPIRAYTSRVLDSFDRYGEAGTQMANAITDLAEEQNWSPSRTLKTAAKWIGELDKIAKRKGGITDWLKSDGLKKMREGVEGPPTKGKGPGAMLAEDSKLKMKAGPQSGRVNVDPKIQEAWDKIHEKIQSTPPSKLSNADRALFRKLYLQTQGAVEVMTDADLDALDRVLEPQKYSDKQAEALKKTATPHEDTNFTIKAAKDLFGKDLNQLSMQELSQVLQEAAKRKSSSTK